ncbi:MAG: adenylyl-sulfate kinase [Dehalococcoidia bacterium]
MKGERRAPAGWVLWFVGLPGSGKSSLARAVCEKVRGAGGEVEYLEMDERRRVYFPNPEYSSEERAEAYRLFAEEAAVNSRRGRDVIMDGTAPRLWMREYARRLVSKFAEVMVRCPLEVAMERERNRPGGRVMADLYEKALKRKREGCDFEGLGEVVGVDVPFEENPDAECIIESDKVSIEEGSQQVLEFLKRWTA